MGLNLRIIEKRIRDYIFNNKDYIVEEIVLNDGRSMAISFYNEDTELIVKGASMNTVKKIIRDIKIDYIISLK